MCDSAVRSSPGGRGAYPLKCKQPLEAVYNSNLPPLQGEARSGGGMGRGWTMPLTR